MDQAEIEAKARDLVDPILGPAGGAALVAMVAGLDAAIPARALRGPLAAAAL
jgi:hypothetical protein